MWEVMLVCGANNKRVIRYIYKLMKRYVQDKSCILSLYENEDECSILFACSNGKKEYYNEMIKMCIIDYIINVYKYEYLIKNISNFLNDEIKFKSFIKILSLYDKQTDEMVLKQAINIDKYFYIDSFFKFRMFPLINHWKELCYLAKDNFDYFISSDSFVEIMRFLVSTMEESCDKIKILFYDGKYSLYNINLDGESAEKIEECNTPFSLISAVLKICPKNIDVYLQNGQVDEAVKFLQNVYSERLNIIKN